MVWNGGRELLEEISGGELIIRPTSTEFLGILADYLESSMEAAAALEIEMAVTDISHLSLNQSMAREIESLKQNIKDLQERIEIFEAEKSSPKE